MKILQSGTKVKDVIIYTAICPKCGCVFQFTNDEYISCYDWSGVHCPECKQSIDYKDFNDSKEHRIYKNVDNSFNCETTDLPYDVID